MNVIWSWLRAFALFCFFVFSPTSLSAKNLCPNLTGQVYDPTDDIIVTTYHSHMGASFGGPITWGEDMGSDGHDQNIMNLVIPANGYSYTGDVLMLTASGNSAAQGFVLTTDGLWSWGPVGEVVDLRSPNTAIGQMTLPAGVVPTDVLDIKANSDVFFLLTKTGEVWIAGNNVTQVSGNADETANQWHQVETSVGTALTGIVELTGSREVVYAKKADNTIWTWGRGVALGNGIASSNETYATQVSLAGLPVGVTLSQLGTYFDNTANHSGVLALGSDQKLYGIGYNSDGRLINNGANTFIDIWTEVSTPVGESVLFVSTSDNSEEYATAAIITSPGGGAKNKLYTWGEVSNDNIGHGTSGIVEDPALPAGFVVGVNDPVYTSVGGHAMSFAEQANGGQICFVGHIINGSTGGLTANPSSFSCVGENSAGWPPEAALCFQTPPEGNVTGSVQDASGYPLSGVTIEIQDADGNVANDVNGNPLTTTTAADGSYSFFNVITDDYFIVETDSLAYTSVSDSDDTDDSDAHVNTNTNDNSIPITVLKNEVDADNNFIDIFTDVNESVSDLEEVTQTGTVLENVLDGNGLSLTVTAFTVNGQTGVVDSATTIANVGDLMIDSDGTYTFIPLANYNGTVPTTTYTVSNSQTTDDSTLDITVIPVVDIFTDANESVSDLEEVTQTGTVLENTLDGNGLSLTVTAFTVNGQTGVIGSATTIANVGDLTIDSNGTYTFIPLANYNGIVPTATYTVSNGDSTDDSTLDIAVTGVNDIPVVDTMIPDQSNVDADTPSVNVSGSFSDPDGDTLTYTATGLPTGLTISAAGVISGTIDKAASQGGTNGVYSVTVTARDPSNAIVTDTFTWTVTNPAPTATDNIKSTNEEIAVSGNVINNDDGNGVDSDPDGDVLSVTQFVVGATTYTAGQTAELTEGNLTISGSGAYTFTPADNSTDNMPQATYTISDGEGGTDTATLDITVNGVNDAPTANPDTGSTPEDTQLVVAANGVIGNDTDPDGDTLSVTGYNVGGNSATVGSPLVLTEGNLTIEADGSYTFDPAPDFNGAVPTVTYGIEDINGETAGSTLDITVTAVNDAPVAEDDSQSTSINTPVSIPVLNNDHDIENDSLIIADVNTTGTNGTVTFDANGTLIFTPETDFTGTTTFTYTISDGNGGTDTATVMITVTDPTDPASNTVTAVADSASTEMDTNIDIPVLINDYDPEGDAFSLTSIATAPVNGTAIIDDNGTPDDASDDFVTYEPNTDFIGNDTFEYEITDENGNSDIAIVTVTVVDPAADAVPNAVADGAITDQDTPVTIDVLDNDTHPDNDDLNITAFTQPANGVVTLEDDQLVYTPNPGFEGHDTFMYTITDSNGDTASAAVTVTLKRLILTLRAFCENDVPYISYDIQLQGIDPSAETAMLTWTGAGGETDIESGLALSDTHHLWAGAQVDGSGNGTVWPGWNELSDGSWEEVYSDWHRWNPDQSDATVTVTLSVNPTSSVTVQYPPATPVCSANPPQDVTGGPSAQGLPNATDNLNVPITSYSPTVINVLSNGDSFGANGAGTVEIIFTQPTHGTVALDDGGTPNDPTDDVLLYSPKADVNNITDSFTYTITDALGNTSTATVTLDVNCASTQTSDSGDALGTLSIMMMMFLTLMSGLYFIRKEEERGDN